MTDRAPSLLASYYLYQATANCVFFAPVFFVYYLWQPLLNVYMNRLVDSRLRATMLSLQSLVARLALAAVVALLGLGTATVGLAPTLAAGAAAVGLVGGVLLATAPV